MRLRSSCCREKRGGFTHSTLALPRCVEWPKIKCRMSGDKLKAVKAEVVMLDESLATSEEERRELERQAAQKRASPWRETPQV